jgi:hypothetical protein
MKEDARCRRVVGDEPRGCRKAEFGEGGRKARKVSSELLSCVALLREGGGRRVAGGPSRVQEGETGKGEEEGAAR